MAIVKNNFRVSRMGGDFSLETVSGGEDDESSTSQVFSSDVGSSSDVDSGMGSDEIDLSEFGESGMEFCQVGNQSCSIPLELYDLPDLGVVLSLETWNDCLTEEERFALTEYLPDMEQEVFAPSLKELFCGRNFHFGSPVVDFFNMLRGGFCDPRVVLYRQGLNLFQRRQYYHQLRKYQNSMVVSLVQIRYAWLNCNGYGIEERLRFLNILRRQRSLGYDNNGDFGSETDCGSVDSTEAYWSKRFSMDRLARKTSHKVHSEVFSQRSRMDMEPLRFEKEKSKGVLKVAAPKGCKNNKGNFPLSFDHGTEKKREMLNGGGRDSVDRYFEEQGNMFGGKGDWNAGSRLKLARSSLIKSKNKKDLLKKYGRDTQNDFGEEETERRYVGSPDYLGKGRSPVQEVTIASYDCDPVNSVKKMKLSDGIQHRLHKASHGSTRPLGHHQAYDEPVPLHSLVKLDDQIIRGKNLKSGDRHRSCLSRSVFDSQVNSRIVPSAEVDKPFFHPEHRLKILQGKMRGKSSLHQGVRKEYSRGSPIYAQSEETESDSSDKVGEDGSRYPYASLLEFPSTATDTRQSGIVKPVHDLRKANKSVKSNKNDHTHPLDGGMSGHTADEPYSKKVKQKGKTNFSSHLREGKSVRKGEAVHFAERLQPTSIGSYAEDRKRKGSADLRHRSQQTNEMCNLGSDILGEAQNNFDVNASLLDEQRQTDRSENKNQISSDYALENDHHQSSNIPLMGCKTLMNKGKGQDGYLENLDEPSYQQFSSKRQIEDSSTKKKKGKKKADAAAASSHLLIPEPIISEKELELDMKTHRKSFTLITPTIHTGFSFSIVHLLSAVRKALVSPHIEENAQIGNELEKDVAKMQAKKGEPKRSLVVASDTLLSHSLEHIEDIILEHGEQTSLPSVTIQEIVNRVRSNPGDPCILETQEPLQDLVRGALRIFSSRTAPLGAKGWKTLASYEKSNKSWAWVGPLSVSSSDNDNAEETSAENWGIPHKMLVKLVDAFANWLKSGQETLQQIGSLPAPPPMLPALDEKERFRDLKAQKSLNTIKPSSEEVRAYFRKEELLRYSIPDRAFQYTAVDGRKSIVAPLRRGGGKPTSKARDHFMLKPDRPPHVTVLCLVRDAAARLPGSVGTRADVCTLIRDSQYIVEDVTDAQINQVVSGALDRLHYERDPCVQFDGDRKLWVYLHRDREDEDFEDDGTSSTKKWKRQRKDATDNSDIAAVNDCNSLATGDLAAIGSSGCDFHPELNVDSPAVNMGDNGTSSTKKWKRQRKDATNNSDMAAVNDSNYIATGELAAVGSSGYDFHPDLNVDSSAVNMGDNGVLGYTDLRHTKEIFQSYINAAHSERCKDIPISWEVLGVNNLQENKMLCQENSTNKDFDDESLSRDRTIGFLSESLL